MIFYCDNRRHLVCVPYSIFNLHRMAMQLGIGWHFFHKDHYDIPQRRIAEIMAKCQVVSTREIIYIIKNGNEQKTNS